MRTLSIFFALALLGACARAEDYGVFVRHLRQESGPRTLTPKSLDLPIYPADLQAAGIEGYASIRFRVGVDGSVTQADAVAAIYPLEMQRAGIRGSVVARLMIDESGKVASVTIVRSSQREFEPAVKNAASMLRFRPASSDGKAVPCVVEYEIRFLFEGDWNP